MGRNTNLRLGADHHFARRPQLYPPTTDTRLIRRICRDFKYRGYLPQEVIRRCPS